ncbi:histidine phosphatase family protein [Rhodococcus sp. 06-1460-1B]|uniref:histidine phosphatase family protein n=1 Tax=Rhodococcus sp. 06-1460-1B TaxID=2022501 RepID=UPI000B9B6E4F|nr:histidine phosphatase family protein [Rhodococcus sp. 06-1460-1B]OZD57249.1 phosphoglycerate mutase [Rhodococcus sp. 06-1460-1B]
MTFLALVRHGETNWNLHGRLQGSSDIPLNDTGRAQAREAGYQLEFRTWDHLISSPLIRASETADIIGAHLGLTRTVEFPDLAERHFGDAEGFTDWDAYSHWPDGRYPGLEPRSNLIVRGVRAVDEIASRYPDSAVIAVAHGGVIRAIFDAIRRRHSPRILNAGVSTLEHDGTRWTVRTINGVAV